MNLLFAIIGGILGGAMFQFSGAVCGGITGWLLGGLNDLRQRQEKMQKELTWLRTRVTEHLREEPEELLPEEVGHVPVQADAEPVPMKIIQEPEPEYVFSCDPEPPSQPSAVETAIRNLLTGENLLVKLGVVILFFGVSFLVKYAAQHGLFPIELRLTAAALGGCALLATGWRLRGTRPVYAQVIQGGGVGIIYLTVYAAMNLYHLVPDGFGFALLVTVCALSAVLAIVQDSHSLAVLGSAGGFLAPQLSGIGGGSPLLLFGYYAVLNGGILAVACQRAWRGLNLLGFAGTFIVSALWGSRFYSPEFFSSVEPFLVLFFAMYAALPVLYASRQPTVLDGYIDCTLVFGTPILAFGFQSALMRQFEYGLAWSALAAGIFYIIMAGRLHRQEPQRLHSLAEAFLALGTVFGTLALPLAFEGRWTSAAWSIEGAALVWTGLRQERRLARVFGYLLLIGSGVALLADGGLRSAVWPVLNSFYIGTLLVVGGALFSARLLDRSRAGHAAYERYAGQLLFAWGMLWWFGGGLRELSEFTSHSLESGAVLAFVAGSCLACRLLQQRLVWDQLEWPALALLPAMWILALLYLPGDNAYPSLNGGWFGWPTALAAWYLILYRGRQREPQLPAIVHAAPYWLLTLLLSWELAGRVHQHLPGMETWAICAWGAVPALALLLIARLGSSLPWPVRGNLAAYLGLGAAPLAAVAVLWLLYGNLTQAGNPWPLPYLPLLNPLDGVTLLVLVCLACWYRKVQGSLPELAQMLPQREVVIALAVTLFIWLNAILLRSIHHWCDVPFTLPALFSSLTVQTALSICWCLLALTVMNQATRRGLRVAWLAGAGLLGAVVAKLFLVDLAGQGSIARIVSFVVVGLLILLIGWFSPVPPRLAEGGAS